MRWKKFKSSSCPEKGFPFQTREAVGEYFNFWIIVRKADSRFIWFERVQFKRIKVEESPPFYRYPLLHRSRLWIRHTRSRRFHPCCPFFFGVITGFNSNKDVGHPVPHSKGVEIIPPGSEALQILGGKSETLENTSSRNSRKIWSAQKRTRSICCREVVVGRRGMSAVWMDVRNIFFSGRIREREASRSVQA